jgi:hypothetical protein
MEDHVMANIEERLLACETENQRLRKSLHRQGVLLAVATLLAAAGAISAAAAKGSIFGSIRATEVAIVDAKGVVRARLGGDLPDAVALDGRVMKRGSKAAGLIIYDEQGLERGGYVTQDEGSNAMLTLDSKYRQAVLLVAAPDKEQVSALKLWTPESAIELRSDSDGSRLSASDKNMVTVQQPVVSPLPAATCARYKTLELEHPNEHICQSRFTDPACRACLEAR